MNGQLSEQPLAELVREISSTDLSGTLRLQHEQGKTAIYFEAGHLIYAASNLAELRLAEYLKKQALVSEEQLTNLSRNRSDISLLSTLCASGLVDRETVQPLLESQVTDLLRMALLWTGGTWEFDTRNRLGDPVRVKLDLSGLLMQTARRLPLKFVASRFPQPDELISPVTGLPDFNALLPAEGFVLSRVDRPIRFDELIAVSGMQELDAIRTIYGLALGGFVVREHWPNPLPRSQPRVYKRVVGADLTAQPAISVSLSNQSERVEDTAEDLDEFLARLDEASNHYQVLSVSATAAATDIKKSYYDLARRYHPDRFHLRASGDIHARIESAFARVTQAYETLTDSSRRSGYDAKLAAQEKVLQFAQSAPKSANVSERPGTPGQAGGTLGESDWLQAENNFKEGYAALQQGNTKQAITSLAAAARTAPQEPRYRAYYGRALAVLQETRRLAEAELQVAIKLDPANASYRVMLAELYCDLGFYRRAEAELERAMTSDPNNAAASKLMRKLEAARATK